MRNCKHGWPPSSMRCVPFRAEGPRSGMFLRRNFQRNRLRFLADGTGITSSSGCAARSRFSLRQTRPPKCPVRRKARASRGCAESSASRFCLRRPWIACWWAVPSPENKRRFGGSRSCCLAQERLFSARDCSEVGGSRCGRSGRWRTSSRLRSRFPRPTCRAASGWMIRRANSGGSRRF